MKKDFNFMKKKELLLRKRFDAQAGLLKLKEEYLNSIYVDRIIDLLHGNNCVISGFSTIAGGGVSFYPPNSKNLYYVGVDSTKKQRWAEVSCPDWKRVFKELEKSFV